MSKKNADREKEEEKDLDEEEEDDETEDDEEEVARPAAKAVAVRSRPRASSRASADARPAVGSKASHASSGGHDDHGHDEEDEDDDDDEGSEEEDAFWWTPHAVMSALVLAGVLGFFGLFNKPLAGIAAHPAAATSEKAAVAATPTPAPPAGNRPGAPGEQREEFGAKHLLVQFKGSTRAGPTITRTDDEAKARATEALKKAKSGAKFEDLVKEYSDEPGAAGRGGDLGKFRKGRMDPVFQAAVEKLKVGEVSDLVKTQFGYHIIVRTQ